MVHDAILHLKYISSEEAKRGVALKILRRASPIVKAYSLLDRLPPPPPLPLPPKMQTHTHVQKTHTHTNKQQQINSNTHKKWPYMSGMGISYDLYKEVPFHFKVCKPLKSH